MNKVAVIGSGPAGLSAALALRENGRIPVIFERRDLPALKLLASGGGRCNFTNILDQEAFMSKFGRNGRFMRDALRFAPREWLVSFLETHGVPVQLTDGFYYFPESGRARDILNAFLTASRAVVKTSSEVSEILTENGAVSGIRVNGIAVPFETVILAAGGPAWRGLGSASGLKLAEMLGHTVVKPLPAVAPLLIREDWVKSLAGVSLERARLFMKTGKHRVLETVGSLLFTHEGLSGFSALDLAGDAAAVCAENGDSELFLCVRPEWNREDWALELERWRREDGWKLIRSHLARHVVRSVADMICDLSECYEVKACNLPAVQRDTLLDNLTALPLTVYGAGPMGKAMAMRGGVSLKEIHPATLEGRLVKGLYFAGEILDLAGPCGGYNMQWAFSSGRLAGSLRNLHR